MKILDSEILVKACKGDLDSFEQIFRHYQPALYSFGYEFFHDQDKAKDIVQECFINLWTRLDTIKDPTKIGPYLYSTMRYMCRQEIRRNHIVSGFQDRDALLVRENELNYFLSEDSPLDYLYFAELDESFQNAVSALPDRCRQIFIMRKEDGLSNKEIASKLGISIRTVENEVYRGLQSVRLKLKWYIPIIIALLTTI